MAPNNLFLKKFLVFQFFFFFQVHCFNLFQPNFLYLHPLKTSKNQSSSYTFRGYGKSNQQWCSIKKVLLKILQNSQKNTCPRVSFLIPKTKLISKLFWIQTRVFVVTISYLCTETATRGVLFKGVLKKRLWRRCVPVNFVKYLRTYFLQNTYGRLLLYAKTSLTEKKNSYWNCIYRNIYSRSTHRQPFSKALI